MKQTRDTSQRRLIRTLMQNNFDHPTADELYEAARQQNPTISRGTVYRNLNLLTESGEITRLAMPMGPDHFDCRPYDHYHFLCRRCNRVLDTGLDYDEHLNLSTPRLLGCRTEWHRLILVGLCADCSRQ